MEIIERRGRPAKHLTADEFSLVLTELSRSGATFAQACDRAGTSAYVVKKAMAESEGISFEVRLACMVRGRKKLCDRGLDADLAVELAREAARVDAGEARREWPDVLAAMERRRDQRAAIAAARAEIDIPAARTPEEEMF